MTSYNIYTVAELKNIARERGVSGYNRLRRDELIELLRGVVPNVVPTVAPTVVPPEAKMIQTESNILSIPPQADIFYQFTNHLTFSELKALCSTNKEYFQLCQGERFRPILKQKAQQAKEALLNQIKKSSGKKFVHETDNPERDISIRYIGDKFEIEELVLRTPGVFDISKESIFTSLFPTRSWSKSQGPYLNVSLIHGGNASEAKRLIDYWFQQPDFNPSQLKIY